MPVPRTRPSSRFRHLSNCLRISSHSFHRRFLDPDPDPDQDQHQDLDLESDLDQHQDLDSDLDQDQNPDLDIGRAVFCIRFIDYSKKTKP